MLVCNFCKGNLSDKTEYYVPVLMEYEEQCCGVTIRTFKRVEDCKVNLCQSCKIKLANLLTEMEQ